MHSCIEHGRFGRPAGRYVHVAVGTMCEHRSADYPRYDSLSQFDITGIESSHEPDLHHTRACTLFEAEDLFTLGYGRCEWLLAKNWLAGGHTRIDILGMRCVDRGDDHCVHLRQLNEVLSRRQRSGTGNVRGNHFGTVQIDIGDGTDFRSRDRRDRKSTRLNSSHTVISYAVFCLKKKK